MRSPILRHLTVASAAVLAVLIVAACGTSGSDTTPDPTESDGVAALPPVIAEVADLDGATFEISNARPLVVNAPDPTTWSGESVDAAVAEFVPGRDDGSAVFNPGFEAKGPGSTEATMTAPDGTVYTFTIVVR